MAMIFIFLAGLALAQQNSPWESPNAFSEAGSASGFGSGTASGGDSPDTQYDPELLRLIEKTKSPKMLPGCLNCQLAGEAGKTLPVEALTFEDQKKCGKERNYFSEGIAKIPQDFRKVRENLPEAQIPRSCINYAMKFGVQFARCAGPTGQPALSGKKPCVTEAYVNVVYNSYVDVMDCFGMSQKYFIPKLFNESGFHINALGNGGYMGIGQLGGSAMRDVNEAFSDYIKIITEGTKPSCKRLNKNSAWLKQVASATGMCQMLAPPQSPVVNLIYTAMLHLQNKKSIDERYQKEEIKDKINKLGLIDFDEGRLKEIMYTLSYNTGPGTAMNYLKNYLKVRKEQKGNLVLNDFDFSAEGGGGKKQSFRLTFPRYLSIHQSVGGRGYNSLLVKKKKELDQALGPGICTQEPYLAL